MGRALAIIKNELVWNLFASGWRLLAQFLRILPNGAFPRLRVRILRAWGLQIGHSTLLVGTPEFAGDADPRRSLVIGSHCYINTPVYFDVNERISIGSHVSIGHHVSIITTNHRDGGAAHRAGALDCKPVVISDGAWIGAGVMLLPGTIIGCGAIVAAGAVVRGEIPANTLAAGIPARVVRMLSNDD